MTRPNILLIEADQMAAFVLSMYAQGGQAKTPNLDALAAEGVVFENAYSNSPICCPSRASKFTGRLPSTHEVWGNGAEFRSELPTMMHFLRSEGYRCAVSGKCHFLGLMTGDSDSVKDEAIAEYYGPGVIEPRLAIRKDRWKYVWTRNHDGYRWDYQPVFDAATACVRGTNDPGTA